MLSNWYEYLTRILYLRFAYLLLSRTWAQTASAGLVLFKTRYLFADIMIARVNSYFILGVRKWPWDFPLSVSLRTEIGSRTRQRNILLSSVRFEHVTTGQHTRALLSLSVPVARGNISFTGATIQAYGSVLPEIEATYWFRVKNRCSRNWAKLLLKL